MANTPLSVHFQYQHNHIKYWHTSAISACFSFDPIPPGLDPATFSFETPYFARLPRTHHVGRILETTGQAAQIVWQGPDIVKTLVLNQSDGYRRYCHHREDESADLDSLLGIIFYVSNTGTFALARKALSHDPRLDAAFFQSQTFP